MNATPYQVMPPLAPDEFEALKADIKARGVQVPVEYDEMGNILDGHHRVQACFELGVTHWPRLVRHGLSEEEKRRHARRLNLDRRHLNQEQRRDLIAAELRETPSTSDRAIASGLGVDHKTVGAVRDKLESTGEIPQLEQREGRDNRTRRITQFVPSNKEEQRGLRLSAKQLRAETQAEKKDRREEREQELGRKLITHPERKFGVALEDFEWDHEPWSRKTGMDRHPSNHYPTAADAHTPEEIVNRCAERFKTLADDCVLYKWTTIPHEAIAHRVLELQGFKYVTQRVWGKLRKGQARGTGYWVTGEHEILLIAVRGNVVPPATAHFRSFFIAPVREHSEKPDEQYEHAEYHYPSLPKIELNARRGRVGWTPWGFEAPVGQADLPGKGEAA